MEATSTNVISETRTNASDSHLTLDSIPQGHYMTT